MSKDFWLNLPVKDVKKSKEFFAELGFSFTDRFSNTDAMAGLIMGEKHVVVMLFPEATFKGFTGNELTATKQSNEVLLSIDAESKEEVDEMFNKALKAGGSVCNQPGGSDWMYGCVFADLDGHRWNVLYMDTSKMPQS